MLQFGFNDLENSNIKLTEFIEKYQKYSEATKAENTFLLDDHSLRVLKEFVADIYLKNISYKMLEDFKLKRMEQVKSTSVNLEIRHLKAAYEMARKWGYITSNPFQEVKQIKIKSNLKTSCDFDSCKRFFISVVISFLSGVPKSCLTFSL